MQTLRARTFVRVPCAVLTLIACSGCWIFPWERAVGDGVSHRSARVARLFDAMANHEYRSTTPPALGWNDVPSLLDLGASVRTLTDFPRNPLSSHYEESCSEGMIALWLIEGVRRGGGFASLNALCLSPGTGPPWGTASGANHSRVLAAYRQWWAKARLLPDDRARWGDPLQGTGLRWH